MSIWKLLPGKEYAEGISHCLPVLCYIFRKACEEPILFLKRVNSQFTTIPACVFPIFVDINTLLALWYFQSTISVAYTQ